MANRDPRIPPAGTVLTRAFKGQNIVVLVKEDGFECEGNTYKSLSGLAEKRTGTVLNGYAFFNLGRKVETPKVEAPPAPVVEAPVAAVAPEVEAPTPAPEPEVSMTQLRKEVMAVAGVKTWEEYNKDWDKPKAKSAYELQLEKVQAARAVWTKAAEDLAVAEGELEDMAECDENGKYTGALKVALKAKALGVSLLGLSTSETYLWLVLQPNGGRHVGLR